MRFVVAAALALAAVPEPAAACQQLPMAFFDFGSAALRGHEIARLRYFADQMRVQSGEIELIEVVGHSDRTGSPAARERIARRRAEAVRDLLVSLGLPAGIVSASGAADRRPLAETDDHVREPQNRRVELAVTFTPQARAAAAARREEAIARGEGVPMC
ncbi:MAG TPA: OmpA family protein [Allosphingosinicella sp.]|jgi:OOP family OmpA-OmpF porin